MVKANEYVRSKLGDDALEVADRFVAAVQSEEGVEIAWTINQKGGACENINATLDLTMEDVLMKHEATADTIFDMVAVMAEIMPELLDTIAYGTTGTATIANQELMVENINQIGCGVAFDLELRNQKAEGEDVDAKKRTVLPKQNGELAEEQNLLANLLARPDALRETIRRIRKAQCCNIQKCPRYGGTKGMDPIINRHIAQAQAGAITNLACCPNAQSSLCRKGITGFVDPQQLAKTLTITQLASR